MSEPEYQYAVCKVWAPEFGGHAEIRECSGEADARGRVDYWERSKARNPDSRLADYYVVRRPVGEWERG